MKLEITPKAVAWFKEELELPDAGKVLHFIVRYGGEFQLKQGFSPAFNVDFLKDINEVGFEMVVDDLHIVIAEKDIWYYEDHQLTIDIVDDEIIYHAQVK
ncbi:HesB/YadR/YfhF family protein [Staphylococcus americanisciuri]|uniref:Iron-sulfur cluster biosynthesis protein n=1 Tax=Staphylococcus americanisciuri TaxID=2973940 RepID=A0ABT2EYQ2_9STAP|nr:hypothetical protein [Staphylococcus americanisciuri]MCS4485374.1 hypothetical protein [Staphylococcus americanisciuri]